MMKALVDANVVLDTLLGRSPFDVEANHVWDAVNNSKFEAFVTSITVLNVHYVVKKFAGRTTAVDAVKEILKIFKVISVDRITLEAAQLLSITDYEDAVQHAAAEAIGIDTIITRDVKDFKDATLTILTPADFLKKLP